MTDRNNNLPIFSEELTIENKTDKSIQTQLQANDILKTKQLIPHNFVQLETKGKNCMCSTENWKEPVCERYGFTYENKWIQLDIPCELMEKLELKKGESIIHPIYISSNLLKKEPEFGGITLEKEDEIFLLKPLTGEKGTQTELNEETIKKLLEEKIEGLERIVANSKEKYEKLKKEMDEQKTKLESDLEETRQSLNNFDVDNQALHKKVSELENQVKDIYERYKEINVNQINRDSLIWMFSRMCGQGTNNVLYYFKKPSTRSGDNSFYTRVQKDLITLVERYVSEGLISSYDKKLAYRGTRRGNRWNAYD